MLCFLELKRQTMAMHGANFCLTSITRLWIFFIKVFSVNSSRYSLINMRQLEILFYQAETWHRIVCWFSWISLFLPVLGWCDHKVVLFWYAEQFYDHIIQELVETGKFSQINKQSNVKFWLNWIKFGAVSYLLSCNIL